MSYGGLIGAQCEHPDGCQGDPNRKRRHNTTLGVACTLHYARIKNSGKWGPAGYIRKYGKVATEGSKECTRCGEFKTVDTFGSDQRRPDGLNIYCKSCVKLNIRSRVCAMCGSPSTGKRDGTCGQECHLRWKVMNGKNTTYVDEAGYVVLTGHIDHPNCRGQKGKSNWGHIFEHVVVMVEHLDRPLVEDENVHHKNGVRDDNRIENLELWSKSQPFGQRVEDKVEWAIELLTLYRPEALASEEG